MLNLRTPMMIAIQIRPCQGPDTLVATPYYAFLLFLDTNQSLRRQDQFNHDMFK